LSIVDNRQQKLDVSKRLNSLLQLSDKGNYVELRVIYPEYHKRNEIVDKLYNFTTSFNGSPVYISEHGKSKEHYSPKKFSASVKKNLQVEVKELIEEKAVENALAMIKITTKGGHVSKKIKEIVNLHQHSLSYSP